MGHRHLLPVVNCLPGVIPGVPGVAPAMQTLNSVKALWWGVGWLEKWLGHASTKKSKNSGLLCLCCCGTASFLWRTYTSLYMLLQYIPLQCRYYWLHIEIDLWVWSEYVRPRQCFNAFGRFCCSQRSLAALCNNSNCRWVTGNFAGARGIWWMQSTRTITRTWFWNISPKAILSQQNLSLNSMNRPLSR